MTISKKAQAAKEAAAKKAAETPKNKAKGFLNWAVAKADGSGYIRSDRGLPIFLNPEYPSPKEELLLALAEKHGGSVELDMKVRIQLTDTPTQQLSVEDIMVAAA